MFQTATKPPVVPLAVQVTRPWFWLLGWAPLWFGTTVATGSWWPATGERLPFVATLLVMGPLVWGSVCAVNDLHDEATDRLNPRKAGSPLVGGRTRHTELARWHGRLTLGALAVALLVGPMFALGTAGVLGLGWAYSAPPLRLKGRPGWDVLANAVPIGLLAPLAGWSLHRPVLDYPPLLVVLGPALAAALYLPTLVLDRVPDAVAGIRTFAVAFGDEASYRLGVLLWAVATSAWLAALASGVFGDRQVGLVQVALVVVVLGAYVLLTHRPTITRMALVCAVFCLPMADFLIHLIHHPAGA